jgi:hypothetical protein
MMVFAASLLLGLTFSLCLLVWQSRLLKRAPTLRLRMVLKPNRVVGRALLLAVVAALLFAAFSPPLAAGATLALCFSLSVLKTITVDLWLASRIATRIRKGDFVGAMRLSTVATVLLTRHGPTIVAAELGRKIAFELAKADRFEAAAAVMSKLEKLQFYKDTWAWAVALDLANYRIALGQYVEAKRALDACEKRFHVPTKELRSDKELLLSRIDAATGEPERALERVGDRTGTEWDFVRAHAHAAAGRETDARQALERIGLQKHGAYHLRAVATRGGPAAQIARSMLEGETAPYR